MLQGREQETYTTIKVDNPGGWQRGLSTFKAYITSVEFYTPTTYCEVIKSPFAAEWRKAMEEEV